MCLIWIRLKIVLKDCHTNTLQNTEIGTQDEKVGALVTSDEVQCPQMKYKSRIQREYFDRDEVRDYLDDLKYKYEFKKEQSQMKKWGPNCPRRSIQVA